jgi:ACR3 family arsenite efflux pump ArsB
VELTTDDFRRVARQPGAVVAATVVPFVLLPVLGWFLVGCLNFQPALARGVLLVAACWSGAMVNVYTYLGRSKLIPANMEVLRGGTYVCPALQGLLPESGGQSPTVTKGSLPVK